VQDLSDEQITRAQALPSPPADEIGQREVTIALTLTVADAEALARECSEIGLTPKQWIVSLVRARLHGTAQFGRTDRIRVGRCLEVLRAIEEQVARGVRALRTQDLPPETAALRTADLTSFALYVARVRDTIEDAIGANRRYWRGRQRNSASGLAPTDEP
jgi:hypothetical protein